MSGGGFTSWDAAYDVGGGDDAQARGQPDVRSGVAAALTPELGLPRDEDEDRRQEHVRDGREDSAAYGHDDLEPCAGA